MKLEFSRRVFERSADIKFHQNPSNGSRVVRCGCTDRRTDGQGTHIMFLNTAKNRLMLHLHWNKSRLFRDPQQQTNTRQGHVLTAADFIRTPQHHTLVLNRHLNSCHKPQVRQHSEWGSTNSEATVSCSPQTVFHTARETKKCISGNLELVCIKSLKPKLQPNNIKNTPLRKHTAAQFRTSTN